MKPGETCRLLKNMASFHGYSVVRPIACGGESEVWLVRHGVLQADFAVKVMPKATFEKDPELKRQFSVEARVAGRARHPSLLSVYDAGLDERTGLYFLVMDFMSRGSVAARLSVERKFSVRKAASIVRMVAMGLCELKKIGIVHRDVKPQNMLVAANGDVKLADFGISLSLNSRQRAERNDVAVGTPLYMSYEQISDSGSLDCRADVYSLGVSFFEMLTGVCPDSELTADQLFRARLNGKRLPNVRTFDDSIPEGVANLVYRMTDPDVSRRVDSPEAVVAEIDAILGEGPGKSGGRESRWVMPSILVVAVGLFSLLCCMFVKIPSWMAASREQQAKPSLYSGDDDIARIPVNVVTQFVETTREIVKTVVVTASVDSARFAPVRTDGVVEDEAEVASEPEPEPAFAVADKTADESADEDDEEDEGEISRTVCGIRIECRFGMTNALNYMSRCILLADAEVRKFFPIADNVRVQNSVDVVRIVKSCNGAGGWKHEGKTFEIGLGLLRDGYQLAYHVTCFMMPRRDGRAKEPFANEIYRYIEYRVWEGVLTARRKFFAYKSPRTDINEAIEFCKATRRQYGPNDYNGQRRVYGSVRNVVPRDKIRKNRVGNVFMVLDIAESLNKSAIKRYFIEKRRALNQGALGSSVSASDFAAMLSNAVGYNLFPLLSRKGWNVDKHAAKVKLRRLLEPQIFGDG